MNMTQEQAIDTLQKLIDEIDTLKTKTAFSEQHTRWLTNVSSITEELFGQRSRIHLSIANLPWQKQGTFIVNADTEDINEEVKRFNHQAYLAQLDTAKGLLKAGIDQIKLLGIDKVYKGKDTPREANEIIKILDLAENKLRKIIREVPQAEKDIQDKFEDLLNANDIKFLKEQEKIAYSSKTYHPDFCFPKINTVLEIKFCDKQGREKELISEINDDIVAYKTKYSNVIFLVYDMGHIRDRDRFKADIEAQGAIIIVVKH